MLSSSQRPAMRVHRTRMLSWLLLLSLALHLMLLTWLLMFPSRQPPGRGPEPLSVEIITETGSASAAAARASAEEAGEPVTPAAPIKQAEAPPSPLMTIPAPEPVRVPVQPAVVPTPAPEVPLALPFEQAEIPFPPVVPDVLPPPPVHQTEAAPSPAMPPSRPTEHPRPRPAPPQHPAARPAPTRGSNVARSEGGNVAGGASSANNGAAWMGRLKQWWDQHSFYPREASQSDEGGNVKVRIVIAADGQVTSIEVVQSSGSSVLDAAALAVFRNARLSPLSPGALAQPADVVVTLHYHPIGTGG